MVEKQNNISRDLLIHPGETIADIIEDRNLTQKELANRAGVSEAFLSAVIKGKKDISNGLAKGLEYALGVPSSFWLNLQANYNSELLMVQEEESIETCEKEILSDLKEVITFLRKGKFIPKFNSDNQTIIDLRKFFQISSLSSLYSIVPTGAFRFAENSTINRNVLGAWLCLCKVMSTQTQTQAYFKKECVPQLIKEIKDIMCNEKFDNFVGLKDLLIQYGIDFSIVHNFKGAPVQGYILRKDDETYKMILTIRKAFADIFWFSLFHELGHITNGDLDKKTSSFIDTNIENNARETAANKFAADSLLDPDDYQDFVNKGVFDIKSIDSFAKSQNVPIYIVIGRLQKEEIIPWSQFAKYKPRYKWAE